MKTLQTTVLMLALAITIGCAVPHGPRCQAITVEPLPPMYWGRGDYAFYSSPLDESPTLNSVFCLDPKGGAVVKVNGRVIPLTFKQRREHNKIAKHDSVGDRVVEVWQSADTSVTLNYRITFVCPPGDEACEVTRYEGTMQVQIGTSKCSYHVWGHLGV